MTQENEPAVLLKKTISRCPVCAKPAAAEVLRIGGSPGKVMLSRVCAEHGELSTSIASDARFYWFAKGAPENGGGQCCKGESKSGVGQACCAANGQSVGTLGINAGGKGNAPFEKLATCLALIEIVHSCNLPCPTCYADSRIGVGQKVDAVPLDQLKKRIQGVLDRKGGIEILQLSGGEPTLHPDFFELLDWVKGNPAIDYVLLNTNGVRIAAEDDFVARLASFVPGLQLYLQFDGVQVEGQHRLRGSDLRQMRERAIQSCAKYGVPITLAMTVTPENLGFVWQTIEFGLKHPHIRGVSFQPFFKSGRTPGAPDSGMRLNTADIILALVEQSNGKLRFRDFTPLPCGDPNCATIGYLLRAKERLYSISDFIDFGAVQGFLRDKVRYSLDDLSRCGCESEPLGALLKQFEMDERNAFRMFIKPFMDTWTWDEDRIDRCCTHVIRPDGQLDSFCRVLFRFSGYAGRSGLAMIEALHHSAYRWWMLAGIAVSAVWWWRQRNRASFRLVYVAALLGAFLGAKIAYLSAEGWMHFDQPDMWVQLATGKSILGALLGGYLAVEFAKKKLGSHEITGDAFAAIAPIGILLGRIGCWIQGCCLGKVCAPSWFTIDDSLGRARWPAVPIEILFNAGCALFFWSWRRNRILPGQHFHIYLMAYGAFRFVHEFARATPDVLGPFSGYQFWAAALFVFGFVRFRQRASAGGALRAKARVISADCFASNVGSSPKLQQASNAESA